MMGSKVNKVATFKYPKDAPERHVFAEIRGTQARCKSVFDQPT